MTIELTTAGPPLVCGSWCASLHGSAVEHDLEPVAGIWWHTRHIGSIPTQENDLGDDKAPRNAPFDVDITQCGDEKPTIDITIQGWAETAVLSVEDARQAVDVLSRAVSALDSSGLTR